MTTGEEYETSLANSDFSSLSFGVDQFKKGSIFIKQKLPISLWRVRKHCNGEFSDRNTVRLIPGVGHLQYFCIEQMHEFQKQMQRL